jgi:hypothetical protein
MMSHAASSTNIAAPVVPSIHAVRSPCKLDVVVATAAGDPDEPIGASRRAPGRARHDAADAARSGLVRAIVSRVCGHRDIMPSFCGGC